MPFWSVKASSSSAELKFARDLDDGALEVRRVEVDRGERGVDRNRALALRVGELAVRYQHRCVVYAVHGHGDGGAGAAGRER